MTNDLLAKRIADLERQLSTAKAEYGASTARNNELRRQLGATIAERDALAAQVDLLKDSINKCTIDNVALLRLSTELKQAVAATPQQCLRDVQAEAGRAGYLQGLLSVLEEMEEYGAADVRNAEREADKYAAKVRQGGAE